MVHATVKDSLEEAEVVRAEAVEEGRALGVEEVEVEVGNLVQWTKYGGLSVRAVGKRGCSGCTRRDSLI